jgi:activator of HSP90 ATPase
MSRTISEVIDFDVGTPQEIYNLYMDSQKQSDVSGSDVNIGQKAGDRFTALNGMIKGTNLYIIPNRMIIQSWRSLLWKKDVLDAVVTIIFNKHENRTQINLINANLPDHERQFFDRDSFLNLWKSYIKAGVKEEVKKQKKLEKGGLIMAKTINETFECEGRSPKEMFQMFMDSKKISELTGYETSMGEKVEDKFFALNGAVIGKNLLIIPNRMIVQSWRWLTRKKEFTDSILVMVFSESEKGSVIEFSSANLQNDEMPFINKETYLDPLKEHLESMAKEKSEAEARKIAREKAHEESRKKAEEKEKEKAREMAREKKAREMTREKRAREMTKVKSTKVVAKGKKSKPMVKKKAHKKELVKA